MKKPRFLSVLANVSLSICGAVIGLFALELGSRAILPPPRLVSIEPDAEYAKRVAFEQANPDTVLIKKNMAGEDNSLYLRTPSGRRLRRNTVAVIENHETCQCRSEIRTNSLGYRGPEIGPKKDPRVLFLGDSITFSDYIPEEQSWVRLIETESRKAGRPLEAINSGVWAIGLANEIAILHETGLSTDPDLVVLNFYLNDIENSPGVKMLAVPGWLWGSRLAQYVYQQLSLLLHQKSEDTVSGVSDDTWKIWKKNAELRYPPPKETFKNEIEEFNFKINQNFYDWGSSWSDDVWDQLYPLFAELKRVSLEHKFKLAIVIHPVADQVYAKGLFDYPQQKLKEVGEKLDIPVLDLLPKYRSEYTPGSGKPLFYDWCHPTVYGNSLLAQWIGAFVAEEVTR